jgi:hypothetical protein
MGYELARLMPVSVSQQLTWAATQRAIKLVSVLSRVVLLADRCCCSTSDDAEGPTTTGLTFDAFSDPSALHGPIVWPTMADLWIRRNPETWMPRPTPTPKRKSYRITQMHRRGRTFSCTTVLV